MTRPLVLSCAIACFVALFLAALPSTAQESPPRLIGGAYDPALPAAMLQRSLNHPQTPLSGCVRSFPEPAGKTGACPPAWQKCDAAPFLYGDTFVIHIFVTDDNSSWSTSSWWPWDWTRCTAAATARDAVEWIEDHSPGDLDVSFSIAHTDSFYYYNATVSGRSAHGDPYAWTSDTVPQAIGFGDYDGDGFTMDDLLESNRSATRTSGTWDNVIAVIHVNHNGRSHAYSWLATSINYEEYGDWNTYAHEIMHLYGASDEYEDSVTHVCGGGGCTDVYENEWLETNYVNGNCELCGPGHHCVMLSQWADNLMICDWTKGHIGWRDEDSDGWDDLEEAMPWAEVTVDPPQVTGDPTAYLAGRSYSPYRWSPITRVEYRVDSGTWLNATPSDGSWNNPEENFQIDAGLSSHGSHTIEARAHNSMGKDQNCDYETFSIFFDDEGPPAPTISSSSHPSQVAWYPNRNLQASWTEPVDIGGVSGYSYVWDRNPSTVPDTNVDTTQRSASTVATGDDIHYFHVRAVDGYGNWGPAAHRTFKHDNTAPDLPDITCTSHTADTYSNAVQADFNWSTGDTMSGLQGTVWSSQLDQNASTSLPGTNPQSGSSRSFGLDGLPDGDHYFHVRAADWAGNWTATAHRRIRVDREAPWLAAGCTSHPDPSRWYANGDVTYSWSFTKTDLSGITGYSYAQSGDSTVTPDRYSEGTSNSKVYNGLASGRYWFGVHGVDAAGNWGSDPGQQGIVRVSARVDVTDPSLVSNLASPSHADAIGEYDCMQSADRTVDVTWSAATDAHSGLEGYSICWNQAAGTGPDSTKDFGSSAVTTTSATLADGESWYFHIRAVDEVGNWDNHFATLGPFFIAATPPAVPSNLTANAGNATVTLRWNHVSASTPITYKVYRRIGDGSYGSRLVEGLQDTTYTDVWPSVLNGETYHYAVAAVDSCLRESAKSWEGEAAPEYASPGNGRRWDLTDLVNNSKGGVRNAAPLFRMHGTVKISAGDTLDIDPGHQLYSQDLTGTRKLRIEGVLLAPGTAAQSITFASGSSIRGGWAGIHLVNPGAGSRIDHCTIRHAVTGITWDGGNPLVRDCLVEECTGTGISAVAAPVPGSTCTVLRNTVRRCDAAGIYVFGAPFSVTRVDTNTVTRNTTGIEYDVNVAAPAPVSLLISANDVRNQTGNGIDCGRGAQNVTVSNNSVRENLNGIVFDGEGWMVAQPLVTGNNVSGNANAGIYTAQQAAPLIQNNRIVQNGMYGCYSKTDAWPTLTGNTITGSRIGVAVAQSQVAVPDMGNPPLSPGMNRLDGHVVMFVQNATAVMMNAKSNYWGAAQQNPAGVIGGPVAWNPVWNPPANQAPTINLTAPAGGTATDAVVITWVDGDPDPADNATINLYYDTDGVGFDGTQIDGASNLSEDDPANTFTWDTSRIPAGAYAVYGLISDGSLSASSYSPGMITIQHGDIAVSPDTLEAQVEPGQMAGPTLTIRNSGTAALVGRLSESVAWLSLSDSTFSVGAGDSAQVTVTFDATSLAEDDYAAAVAVMSDDHADSLVTIPALMHVAKPEIDLSAASVEFGGVVVDSSASFEFEIYNLGTADLLVTGLTAGGAFSVSGVVPPVSVAPGDTLAATVSYSPVAPAVNADTLAVTSNDSDEPDLHVPLSGTGLAPELRLSALSHAFGTVAAGDRDVWNLTVSNDGTTALALTSASFDMAGFTILSPSLSTTVAAGDSVSLALAFAPTEARAYAATLTIETNDADEDSVEIDLTGTGAYPDAILSGASLDFGSTRKGAVRELTLRVRNTGGDTLSVTTAATSGPFSVTSPGLPADVAAGDSLALTVRYAPAGLGADAESLFVTTDSPLTPALRAVLAGTGVAPEVSTSDVHLAFGAVHADSTRTHGVRVRNEGTSALTVSAVGLAGGAHFSFAAPAAPFEIAAGDSEEISVTFESSPVGGYADTLAIACDDDDEPALAVTLDAESAAPEVSVRILIDQTGYGEPVEHDVTGGSTDLGPCPLGESTSLTFRVRNIGGYALHLTGASVTPAEYSLEEIYLPVAVAPGEFAPVRVTFTPADTSETVGALTIVSDDRESPSVEVTLHAHGTDAMASLFPSSLAATVFEEASTDLPLSLANTGEAEYGYWVREGSGAAKERTATPKEEILRPAPALPKQAEYSWISVLDSTGFVAGRDTVGVSVHIDATPLAAGVYSGSLLVLTNDPDLDTTSVPVRLRIPRMRYADHDAANFLTTVTDEGAIGFWDRLQDETYGLGFVYPRPGGPQYLFSGSFWAGVASDRVSDASYDYDFDVASGGEVSVEGTDPQRSLARWRDTRAPLPLGIEVEQEGLAYPAPEHDDFLLLNYSVRNVSGTALDGVRVGLYFDWDIGDYLLNEGGYDPTTRAGYMMNRQQADSTHVGIVLVAPSSPSSFHLIHHPTYVNPYGNLRDVDKWTFLSDGVIDDSTWERQDWSMVMAAGPFDLGPSESVRVSFAIVAGAGRQAFLANAAAARILGTIDVPPDSPPARFAVHASHPNPFGEATHVSFDLPMRALVTAAIFDVQGRCVALLARRVFEPGRHSLEWSGRDDAGRRAPAGVYFYRVETPGAAAARKIVLLR
jgi:parallel beta-helix repeat protein